ncbi:MAG: hypothetical protein WBB07_18460, partial [Mycobacterium sp.]
RSGHPPIRSLNSHDRGSKQRGQINWTTKRVPLTWTARRSSALRSTSFECSDTAVDSVSAVAGVLRIWPSSLTISG